MQESGEDNQVMLFKWTSVGGGGGFFLTCKDLGECSTIHSPPVLFCCCHLFEVKISLSTLIPRFMPGSVHSGSAS